MPRYSKTFLDHFNSPRNVGVIEDANGEGTEKNEVCGDTMTLYLRMEGERITEARFQTLGCSASIAASSVITELVAGKSVGEARALTRHDIAEALDGIPPAKLHSAVLAIDALKSALDSVDAKGQAS